MMNSTASMKKHAPVMTQNEESYISRTDMEISAPMLTNELALAIAGWSNPRLPIALHNVQSVEFDVRTSTIKLSLANGQLFHINITKSTSIPIS
jgi:hypothetical protein